MRTMCCVVLLWEQNYVEEKPKTPFFLKRKKEKYWATILQLWLSEEEEDKKICCVWTWKLQPQEEFMIWENWKNYGVRLQKKEKRTIRNEKFRMIYRLWAQDLYKVLEIMYIP